VDLLVDGVESAVWGLIDAGLAGVGFAREGWYPRFAQGLAGRWKSWFSSAGLAEAMLNAWLGFALFHVRPKTSSTSDTNKGVLKVAKRVIGWLDRASIEICQVPCLPKCL
jgi:hypothetical protein